MPSKLKNPVFLPIAATIIHFTSKFSGPTVDSKARLLIFKFAVDYQLSGNLGNIPTDPMTGKPFLVTDKGDSIEIASADRRVDGEPVIVYQVRKPLP